MGKPKRGKKARQDDDWDDDIETKIESLSLENKAEENNGDIQEVTEPKAKKKDKKKKNKKADSEEDEEEKHDSEEEDQGKEKVQKTSAMSAFQMLAMDSDDQESPLSSEPEEDIPKPVSKKDKKKMPKQKSSFDEDQETLMSVENPEPVTASAKGKKKTKEKKADEDIDALLAEIESTDKTGKGKKKKKGKGQIEEKMDDPENTVQADESAAPTVTEVAAKDISEMTQDEIAAWLDDGSYDDNDDKKKKKKKKEKKQQEQAAADVDEEDAEEEEAEGTVKTAAQKKKEKKERQKQQKLLEKNKQQKKAPATEKSADPQNTEAESTPSIGAIKEEAKEDQEDEGEDDDKKKKKKDRKKKKKGEEEQQEEKKKKPSKMALAIQEMQKKAKEEEERIQREEDEKERIIEEKRRLKEETEARERERKEKEKQKKKERIERLKAEGKFLTEKQKADKQRAAQMLEHLKAQGLSVPQPGEGAKKRVVYGGRKKKKSSAQDQQKQDEDTTPVVTPVEEKDFIAKEEIKEESPEEKPVETQEAVKEEDDVKDAWDAESDAEEEKEIESKEPTPDKTPEAKVNAAEEEESDEESEEEEDEESEEESEDESSEEESDEEDDRTPAEKLRDRARARIQKRKETAEENQSTDNLRAPVVCVLGHVDTGKTKILDKLRRTHVQDDEAGGITQQIGATNVPMEAIQNQTKMCKEFSKQELKLPGLLIIDTPGHESFSNLRTRGSSLCDIAILVIDIMHGIEPQTIESINLLKKRKTPFVVALNKIDRLFQWQSNPHTDIVNTLKKQKPNTKQEFEERTQVAIVQLAEQGLNSCLFHENKNIREYVSLVPTSAHSGDGMGNLIALICELTQGIMAKKLAFSEELQATVMEVKAIQGLGTTIDVILVNGRIHEGDTIILAGQEGPIVTTVRALLMPQPMKELRVKNAYNKFKEVVAAQGCKIIAKDLEKALAGLPLYVAEKQDEVEFYKEEISEALEEVLGSIRLQEKGVFVQASTLGSLEALLEFLRTSKIPYAGINIGPVHKKDIMRASVMLERDTQWAVILAFDVKVEREAQDMADGLGVTIFTAEIIYHLFDKFMAHRDQLKKQKQEEFKHIAVFPCKLRILPQCIFNSRDPIVCGVAVEAGFVKIGTPLCVPSKEGLEIGRVTSLEVNHKSVEKATKGQEVCVKIEPIPGDAPKLYGRHFDHTDLIISKISRESIDVVKNYFRDEMSKNDWQLIMELKKIFEII